MAEMLGARFVCGRGPPSFKEQRLPSLSGSPTIPSDSTMGGWMPSFRLGSSWLAALFAVVLAILMQSGTSHAYTPEQQQACQPDAMRLCGEFVPNADAITSCMIRKKSQLSPQCRVFFRSGRGRARPPRHPHHASYRPRCVDCRLGTMTAGEWYMVNDDVWRRTPRRRST